MPTDRRGGKNNEWLLRYRRAVGGDYHDIFRSKEHIIPILVLKIIRAQGGLLSVMILLTMSDMI